MTDTLRVILEIGKKRRVVAGAMDWPGLDRWGSSEEDAVEKLPAYVPRYAGVAERAGLARAFARARDVEVVERVPGSSSTDFWGVAHVPSQIEAEVLRRPTSNGGSTSCGPAGLTSTISPLACPRLRPGPRSAGRTRDQIIRHVYLNEPEQWSQKVEVRTPLENVLNSAGLAAHRAAYLDAIRTYNTEGKPARSWPIQFLIRRTAHHVMDHAWEMEDRDPNR